MPSSTYHQLGRFVVTFQHVESALTDIMVMLASADDEAIRILVNELSFAQRVKTTDVLFARFLDLSPGATDREKTDFHALMTNLLELGQRRNELVHSKYINLRSIGGAEGLLRTNSRLQAKRGKREEQEEPMLPDMFENDLMRVAHAQMLLENARLNIIDKLYPEPNGDA